MRYRREVGLVSVITLTPGARTAVLSALSLEPWAWTGSTQPPRLGYPSGIMLIWRRDMG